MGSLKRTANITTALLKYNVHLRVPSDTMYKVLQELSSYGTEERSQALYLDARCIGVERRLCSSLQHLCGRTGRIHNLHVYTHDVLL